MSGLGKTDRLEATMTYDRSKAILYNARHADAIADWAQDLQLELELLPDGMIGPKTRAAVLAAIRAGAVVPPEPVIVQPVSIIKPTPPAQLIDIRDIARSKKWTYPGYPAQRGWSDVWGCTLHQTVGVYADTPDRWKSLNAHFGITRAGNIYWVYDFLDIVNASNALNGKTVAIEMEGIFRGHPDRARRGETHLTQAQVDAFFALVRWINAMIVFHGGRMRVFFAHRQSAGDRQGCPGWEPWTKLAMPIKAELGLFDGGEPGHGPAFLDDGRAIPKVWDDSRDVPY